MTSPPSTRAPRRRLSSNIRATLIGNVVYAGGLWIQFAIFARLGGPAAVGTYAFALALCAPVMLMSCLQLRILLASDARGAYSFREYRLLRLATTGAAIMVMIPVALSTGQVRTLWPVLVPVCAKSALDVLGDLYCGLWQQHERMNVIGWASIVNAVASTLFMSAAALLGGSASAVATGAALGSLAALLYLHASTARDADLRRELARGGHPVQWRRLARLAWEAAPLGVIVLLGSLLQNAPRYFIQHYWGEAALGLFAAAYQLTAAGGIVVQAVGGAATPRLASVCAAGDVATFNGLVRKLVVAAVLLGAAGVTASALVGRWVLALAFRPDFAAGAGVLVILSAAAGIGFVATLLGYALTAARSIAIQPVLLSATLAVAVAGCVALVPRHGAAGAAAALAAGAVVQAAWSAVAIYRSAGTVSRSAPIVKVA